MSRLSFSWMESGISCRFLRSLVPRILFPNEASEAAKSLVRDLKRTVSFSTGDNLQKGLIWSLFAFFFFAFRRLITITSAPLGPPRFKVPMKWNFSPVVYSRKLKSMLHWFIIFKFKLWSGAQNNFSIATKLAKNAIVVFRGLELVTS